MSALKLADIPLENPDVLAKGNTLGKRLVEILKHINFPDRDKTIIALESTWPGGYTMRMHFDCVDTKTGAPIALQHLRSINDKMTDAEIAREVCIMMSQFAIHEYMENFRYEGKILFDPHDHSRSETIFSAIEAACTPPKVQAFVEGNVMAMDFTFTGPTFDAFSYSYHTSGAAGGSSKVKFAGVDASIEPIETVEATPFEKAKAKQLERKKAFSKFGAKDWRDKKKAA